MADTPHIMIVEARFYEDIADELIASAIAELDAAGATYERFQVPGAFEIPTTIQYAVRSLDFYSARRRFDGYVALGCVIRGETTHYELVSEGAAQGIQDVQLATGVPIAFGLVTVENEEQALARSQGPGGHNVGEEAALVAVEMARLAQRHRR